MRGGGVVCGRSTVGMVLGPCAPELGFDALRSQDESKEL